MSQGRLPSAKDRLEGRIPVRIPLQMLPRCIQGSKKRWCNLPTISGQDISPTNWLKPREEAEAAFRQMKEHIAKLPMLTALEEQEELIVYVATSKEAVSVVLMTEREARQMTIYFVSRALRGPEVNYTSMEKLVLALVHASKRLRRYF
ncbi:reverse transcriptase domain-containing protein [Tanacetum coccineum]